MDEKEEIYVIIDKSKTFSLFEKVVFLLILMTCFWLNYEFIGDSVVLQWFIVFLFVIVVVRRTKYLRFTKKEALDYFRKLNKE